MLFGALVQLGSLQRSIACSQEVAWPQACALDWSPHTPRHPWRRRTNRVCVESESFFKLGLNNSTRRTRQISLKRKYGWAVSQQLQRLLYDKGIIMEEVLSCRSSSAMHEMKNISNIHSLQKYSVTKHSSTCISSRLVLKSALNTFGTKQVFATNGTSL